MGTARRRGRPRRGRALRRQAHLCDLDAFAGWQDRGPAAAPRAGARQPPRRDLRPDESAQSARGRGGRRPSRTRSQSRFAGRRRRRLGDRCHQGHAALPVARPRQCRCHGALLPGVRAPQIGCCATAVRADPDDLGFDHPVGLRIHRERRHHAVQNQHQAVFPAPPVCATHDRARPRRHARHPRLAAVLQRASARSTTRSRTTAMRGPARRPKRCPCRA